MRNAIGVLHRGLAANWKLKVALSIALTLFFCIPYFALQRLPVVAVRRLPLSAIDRMIAFEPGWVWVYQSVYLLLSVVPWLASSANDLKRYARGFALQACIGFAFFLLLPIEGPRPDMVPSDVMFRILVSYDAPLNSFPSLHVGLSVYTVLFATRAFRGESGGNGRVGMIAFLAFWAAAIAFAAVATKQHYVVDLPAGAVLAWSCHSWTWRDTPRVKRRSPGREPLIVNPERSANAETIWSRGCGDLLDPLRDGSRPTAAAVGQPTGGSRSRVAAEAQGDLRAGHS